MSNEDIGQGWWWPFNSKKSHYMINGRSLCTKWLCLGNPYLKQGNHDSKDNCKACQKKRVKNDINKK